MLQFVQVVPAIMIVLDVIAALIYLAYGDINHTIYWLAAGVLTACVMLR